jgi:hypothetical protein
MTHQEIRIKKRIARGLEREFGDWRDKGNWGTGKMKRAGVYATRVRSGASHNT